MATGKTKQLRGGLDATGETRQMPIDYAAAEAQIREVLERSIFGESLDDAVQEILLMVFTNQIDISDLALGIKQHLPAIKRKFRSENSLSLDQAVGGSESTLTLKDVITDKGEPPRRKRCMECRKKIGKGMYFCSKTCSCRFTAKSRRKIDPKELEHLNKVRFLPRDELATIFGVTRHAIDNVVRRKKLSRFNLAICKTKGCGKPALKFKNHTGGIAGNLCIYCKRAIAREYTKRHRRKKKPLCTPEERRENARRASSARWEKVKQREVQGA